MIFSRFAALAIHKQERYDSGEDALEPEVLRISHLFHRLWFLQSQELEHGHRGHNYSRIRQALREEAIAILAEEGVTMRDLRKLRASYAAKYG